MCSAQVPSGWTHRQSGFWVEAVTKTKHASLWRTHCEPEWATWQMAAITQMEAQEWVNRLRGTRRARHQGRPAASGPAVPALSAATVRAAVNLMSGLYRLAMREHPPLVTVNPFAELELPVIEPHSVDFYEHAEAAQLYEAAGEWRDLIELGMQVGLRTGEMFSLHGHRVDSLRGRLRVVDVMTRQGLREYPKSKKSYRVVPVPAGVLEALSVRMAGRERDGLVFTSARGGPLDDVNFRNRVWYPALPAADHAAHRRLLAGAGRRSAL